MLKFAIAEQAAVAVAASRNNDRYYVQMLNLSDGKGFTFSRELEQATLFDTAEAAVAAIRSRNQHQSSKELFLLVPVDVTEPTPPRMRVVQ